MFLTCLLVEWCADNGTWSKPAVPWSSLRPRSHGNAGADADRRCMSSWVWIVRILSAAGPVVFEIVQALRSKNDPTIGTGRVQICTNRV
jgi:hypothetical protein